MQRNFHRFAVYRVRAFAQKVEILRVFNQIVIVTGNVFGARQNVFVLHDVVKHDRRVVHDIADDVRVAARVNRLEKRPCFNPCFQFGNRHQRQKAHVRTAPLNAVEQRLIFQIADKNVFFVLGQIGIINAVARQIDLFRPPEKGDLLFNQIFKGNIFLLVVTRHVHRLAEKHGLGQRVIGIFAESAVLHDQMFARHDLVPFLLIINLLINFNAVLHAPDIVRKAEYSTFSTEIGWHSKQPAPARWADFRVQ